MPSKSRKVEDRWEALQSSIPETSQTLAWLQRGYAGLMGEKFCCTVSGYCRTLIFEFPGVDFHPDGDEPHHEIYASDAIQACLTTDLVGYFVNSTGSRHYAISPPLRNAVCETDEKVRLQVSGRTPVFLVVEETNQVTPVEMTKGECALVDEVIVEEGEREALLNGGREGEKFIVASATLDGAWPELPNNQHLVNMILAGVRVGQQTSDAIGKFVDETCLVTDDGRYVNVLPPPKITARLTKSRDLDPTAYQERASEIRKIILALEDDIGSAHMALLVNSMYRDEYRDDAYQRLHYLQLWEALVNSAKKHLDYDGEFKDNTEKIVAGKRSLGELRVYRHDIAHWWTDTIDENYLADLYRTINKLMHKKYSGD